MYATIGENGKVNIRGMGIEPGNYYLTLGFGSYLHLYSEESWEKLNKAFDVGLHADVPTILQQDTADLAVRLLEDYEEITTSGDSLTLPGPLAGVVSAHTALRITPISAGRYWRLTPVVYPDGTVAHRADQLR